MELVGEQLINAPRPQVWAAINDPDILSRCIPGCEEVNALSPTERDARVLLKIGPVRARFSGRILMSDIVEPSGCKLSFEGTGGAAGFAKGHSEVALTDEGAQTRLRYTVSASVGGKLGQIGGRLIDASARKVADEFFTALDAALTSSASEGAAPGVESANGMAPLHPAPPDTLTRTPASTPAGTFAANRRRYAEPASAPAPRPWTAALGGEASRAFWFCLGVGTTLLVQYLAR
ncbi:hypothetical protein BCh11DRAFT_04268 [Burkholderia sp. Ch1-1]|uniref:Carbon monoxide dehydrogenase n=1 Tax=Paraburkholderia dioscoreae TaxID=2604047 RepID=A0A5Q4Z1H5_9BURK|nr:MULTISPECIES: carbon monoxide dehydrogenase subunit G [Paraburkholderia]EIF28845.1 hypothetical protein BCh11DRAFT_04268 [Burkholderia sp. Ch1-1]MDR8400700.1 SRPBCC domain-containing protein [Paraburkholderia sp. USG1]VVD26690.1 conserved protein of unknown function [Paraburkholderia dioscoreae]